MIQIDMEMPKSCKECPLTYIDTGDDAYFSSNERRCVIDGSCIDGMSERAYDCPLKKVNPKSDKPSGKCKDCGYYEKCTNLCTKHDSEKVFRNPNWYCADFVRVEEQGECT